MATKTSFTPLLAAQDNEGEICYVVEHDGALWSFNDFPMALACCDETWGNYGQRIVSQSGRCITVSYGNKTVNIRQTVFIGKQQRLRY